ncbi:hypothetical protein FLA_0848 [Filimonas lacunae]|nr:hypothetical protein FLA_0848 [Filimonas lacunae]
MYEFISYHCYAEVTYVREAWYNPFTVQCRVPKLLITNPEAYEPDETGEYVMLRTEITGEIKQQETIQILPFSVRITGDNVDAVIAEAITLFIATENARHETDFVIGHTFVIKSSHAASGVRLREVLFNR